MLLLEVWIDRSGIEINGMSTDRPHDRDAPVNQLLPQIFNLHDPGADMIVLHRFDDPARHCLHIASSHAAVSMQAFVNHDQITGFLVELLIIYGQPATDIDQGILLSTHGATIGAGTE